MRKEERNDCYARVLVKDRSIPGYIRNLSNSGLALDFLSDLAMKKGDFLDFMVLTPDDSQIPCFPLNAKIMWIEKNGVYYSLGCSVQEGNSKLDKAFFQLLDYYNNHGFNPD